MVEDHWDPDHHTLAGSRVAGTDGCARPTLENLVFPFSWAIACDETRIFLWFSQIPLISKWFSLWFSHDFHISHIFSCFLWLPICPYDFTILPYDLPICSNDFHIFSYVFLMTFQPVPMMFLLFPILSYDCPIISYDIPILSFDCPMNLPAFPWWFSYDVPIVSDDLPCLPRRDFPAIPPGCHRQCRLLRADVGQRRGRVDRRGSCHRHGVLPGVWSMVKLWLIHGSMINLWLIQYLCCFFYGYPLDMFAADFRWMWR